MKISQPSQQYPSTVCSTTKQTLRCQLKKKIKNQQFLREAVISVYMVVRENQILQLTRTMQQIITENNQFPDNNLLAVTLQHKVTVTECMVFPDLTVSKEEENN